MTATRFEASPQVVIHGGGIAGLWTLHALIAAGFDAVLLENRALGYGQTIGCQGVVHGGAKYMGTPQRFTGALREAPLRWRQALETGGVLEGLRTIADRQLYWSTTGRHLDFSFLSAQEARPAQPNETPPFLSGQTSISSIEETVVEPRELIAMLADRAGSRLLAISGATFQVEDGRVSRVVATTVAGDVVFTGAAHVFTAGPGNPWLASSCGLSGFPDQQLRPLHQVLVKSPLLPSLFGVCLDDKQVPALVVTTHHGADGIPVWCLGGALAERQGCARSPHEQMLAAHDVLGRVFPQLQDVWAKAIWSSYRTDRAEPAQVDQTQLVVSVQRIGNVILGWPIKMALAPHLADAIVAHVKELAPRASGPTSFPSFLPSPAVAEPPWNTLTFESL